MLWVAYSIIRPHMKRVYIPVALKYDPQPTKCMNNILRLSQLIMTFALSRSVQN